VVLLCAAALFLRTLRNLGAVDAGFDRGGVLAVQVDATIPRPAVPAKTPDEHRLAHARLGAMWEDLVARVGAWPGVTSAAAGTMSPLTGRDRGVVIHVDGRRPQTDEDSRSIHINTVTAAYFETTGIRLLSGRLFTTHDRAGSLRVAILNETAARTYFRDESPIGRKVNFPGQRVEDDYEVVGIVRDTRYKSLRTADERMAYVPMEQALDPIASMIVAVRGPGDVTRFVPPLRTTAAEVVPGGFVTRVATIEQRVEASLVRERLLSMLATFFAGLALTLACIGLYGIVAYGVVRRRREIGIRIAIGARQESVLWMVIRETLTLVAAGATLGIVVSLVANRYLTGQLFGVTPGDPLAIGAAILLLVLVTTAAGYVPARRASRINPVAALRYE
jgi:predicted permease